MSPIGQPVTLCCLGRRTGERLRVSGVIREEWCEDFVVEMTSGPRDGDLVVLPKSQCRNLGADDASATS